MTEQQSLIGKRVAFLVADGFEESELTYPRTALDSAGAETVIVSPVQATVRAWKDKEWGGSYTVDAPLHDCDPETFHALVLPGGVMNPDTLRANHKAVAFVRSFLDSKKPVAAICHGPWTLIDADGVAGRKMTSYRSLRTDLENAGADWHDLPVIADGNLITSREPKDLQQFTEMLVEALLEVPLPKQSVVPNDRFWQV